VSLSIVAELDASGRAIVLMAVGADELVARASRLLELTTPLVRPTNPPGGLTMPLSWPGVVQLSATFGTSWRPQDRLAGWIRTQIAGRSTHDGVARDGESPGLLTGALPTGLVPRSYQVSAALMIAHQNSALIFDEMGTGKSVSAVLGIRELVLRGRNPLPCVVICPASVVDHWVEHFNAWFPRMRTVAWRGTPKQRERLSHTADVYVASYDTTRRDASTAKDQFGKARTNPLLRLGARSMIADEVHKCKSRGAAQSLAVRRLARHASHFIGLSGTPITHHPGNLWPALVCLEPGAWPSYERWAPRYLHTVRGDYEPTVIGLHPDTEPEFRLALLGANRRVAKADVLTELPPKIHSIRTVAIPPSWRRVYDDLESHMLATLPDALEGMPQELRAMSVLTQLNQLSVLASAAADVEYTTTTETDPETGLEFEKTHTHLHPKLPSWKVDALLEVLEERCDPGGGGEQAVVFGVSRKLVEVAGEEVKKAGYRMGYVIGGQKASERSAIVRAFQAGELDVLLVTTRAGGEGITLTAAKTAIFLQRPWSMGEAVQCEDRLHRIGAEVHDVIEIIDLMASGTIESRVRAAIREKGQQLSDLVKDPRIVAELLGGKGVIKIKNKINSQEPVSAGQPPFLKNGPGIGVGDVFSNTESPELPVKDAIRPALRVVS